MLRIIAALGLSLATARKTYLVKTESNILKQPKVRAYDYIHCITEDEDNSFCVDLDIDLEIGWEWYQTQVEDNYYRVTLELYTKQMAIVHPDFNYPRLMSNEQTYTMEEFKYILSFDLIYHYPPDLLCFNVFLKREDFSWEMIMAMKLQECLKVLINCMYDFEQWTGEDAKFFEECEQSSK